ncbi:MAG: protein kinase, partial [Vulcanimicrobiota bacterium]
MNRWVVAWLVVSGLCLDVHAQELPIRIDTSRNAAVYIKQIEQGAGYKLLSETTPATYNAQPGETIDIKVTTPHGFFFRWEGDRQNVPGPANVTVRMDRKLAWDRVALAGGGAAIALLGLFFAWRRRVAAESLVARSQIMALTERVASAERVGALGRTLGNYKVLAKLGAGAMGVVYKVESPSGDIFAAKVPNEMDARVVREAEVSKSLRAPNIVESYGLVEGEPSFLLMEYLEGQTLHDWMARNARLPLARID